MAAPAANYHLFHQNMRVFGGGSILRNNVWENAMQYVKLGTATDRVLIAGWTEVMNAKHSKEPLAKIAVKLDVDLTSTLLFACGITCGKANDPEFVGISVSKAFKLEFYGRVLRTSDNKAPWVCVTSQMCEIEQWPAKLALAADARGLGYVGGSYKGQKMVMGFMHNMYTLGDRSLPYSKTQEMEKLIRKTHGLAENVSVYFGGDWNVKPPPKESSKHAASRQKMNVICEKTGDKPTSTTTGNHTYDYFLTSKSMTNPNAQVHTATKDVKAKLSDHAAVSMQIN